MSRYQRKNVFEKLSALIPGYRGYDQREGRRQTDKVLRHHAADRLTRACGSLDRGVLARAEAQGSDDTTLMRTQALRTRAGTIADTLRYAECGGSGFFDLVRVDAATLDAVYRHDLRITTRVDRIVSALEARLAVEDFDENLRTVDRELDDLQKLVDARTHVIEEASSCPD